MARTGVDEFYETIRLLIAKNFWERENRRQALDYAAAQEILTANQSLVARFIEGEISLCSPPDVADECFRTLAPTRLIDTSYEVLHTVFEQMTGRHYKSEKGQFFTPTHIVDFCISVLRPKMGERICDPACGSGAFLKSAFDKRGGTSSANEIFGFDISRRAAKTADLLSYLACDDVICIRQLDALGIEPPSLLESPVLTVEDFMHDQLESFEGFDIIATNPPFAGDVSDASFAEYYETANLTRGRVERDVLFLERCKNLLRPGGRLAIVLPDNKFSASKFAKLREWLLQHMVVVAVVSLHSYSFRPFTSQKTSVLFAMRRDESCGSAPSAVRLYRSDKAGKSSNGDPVLIDGRLDHDLDLIAEDLIEEWEIE